MRELKDIFHACRLLIKKFPQYLLIKLYQVFSGIILTLVPVYTVKYFVLYYTSGKSLESCIGVALVGFGLVCLLSIINYVMGFFEERINRYFIVDFQTTLFRKLGEIDYDFHENPIFLNDYTRALEESTTNVFNTANYTFSFIISLCQSISMFSVLVSMEPFIILFAVGLSIIYLIVRFAMSKLQYNMVTRTMKERRKTRYNERAFTLKETMAELKTSNIDDLLLEKNDECHDNIINYYIKYNTPRTILSFVGNILITLIYPALILIIAYFNIDTLDNEATANLLAMSVAALTISNLISSLTYSISNIQSSSVECKVPFDLLKMHGTIEGVDGKNLDTEFREVVLNNVSFSYDGKHNQLEDISMRIKKGEHIAIVGTNGAGKTTLVKMLLRLYDTRCGDISINGIPYKDLSVLSLRKHVGAVFQNVEVYSVTIAENILLRKVETDADIELVNEALKFAGLYDYVYELPDNINTVVTREFHGSGAIFSGGQNQRLAIARGYAGSYELFILDEPSSALDPLAEAKMYENFLALGKDKTIIFISHRLTSTVNADYIYLFDNGKIIESGTHEELLKLNGEYKQMFLSQASKYLGGDYDEE